MTALPRDAVTDRKMFSAENNLAMLAGIALSVWFCLLKKFPSPLTFAIFLGWSENYPYCGECF